MESHVSFSLDSSTRQRINQNERARQSFETLSSNSVHTFASNDQSPPGEDVLRDSAAYWRSVLNANERVVIDKTGGRNHLFMGSTRPAFIGYSHLHLSGEAGNLASAPHTAALGIVGDIDLRVLISLDDQGGSSAPLLAKGVPLVAPWAYSFSFDPTIPALKLQWTTDGTNATIRTATSAAIPEMEDGEFRWLRVTREATTNAVEFYKSLDGAIWTPVSSHVSLPGDTFASTLPITICGATGMTTPRGKLRRAVIFRGIEEDLPVLDATFSGRPDGTTSFTDLARFLLSPDRGLSLETITGELASTPHAAGLNFTADADVRVKVALEDWHLVTPQVIASKWQTSGQFSWKLAAENGGVVWTWSTNGTSSTSTALPFGFLFSDGSTRWIRVTHDVSNGGQNIVTLWTSTDGGNWEELTNVQNAGTTSIFAGTSRVAVGAELADSATLEGNVLALDVRDGIDGTLIAAPRFTSVDSRTLSVTDEVGRVWTATDVRNVVSLTQTVVNGTEPDIDGDGVQITPTTFAQAAHVAALDIVGDGSVAIRVHHEPANWPPASTEVLIGKRATDSGVAAGYQILANTDGTLEFQVADGAVTSSVVLVVNDLPEGDSLVVARRDAGTSLLLELTNPELDENELATAADTTSGSLANTDDLRIGGLSGGGDTSTFSTTGAAVWTRLLLDSEVADLMVQLT